MNITQERIDDLNAVLKIQLQPEDYKPQVDKALRSYSKKASMPGFRPGMVPMNLVRKMYGKAVLADELNRIVAESVDKYITEQKIDILGNPMPKAENDLEMNWENPADFEFLFDLGLAPQFELNIPPAHRFPYFEITVSDSDIDQEVERLQRRHGDYINPEISDDECSLYGKFEELNEQGTVKEGGHHHQSFLLIEKVKDAAIKKELCGKKIADSIDFNPMQAMQANEEVKYLLGLKDGDTDAMDKKYRYTIERLNKVTKAELNAAFFDKVYGEGMVTTTEEFRNKIKEEIAQSYRFESENKLKHDAEDYFIQELKINLPDEFLKRWIKHSNNKITDDQLSAEYNHYARDLKWRMIENRIFKNQAMDITKEEVENYARHFIMDQYVRYGQAHLLTDEKLNEMADKYMANQDNIQRVIENVTSRKVFEYLNSVLTKDTKNVSYDEFVQLVKAHQHEHH